MIYGQHKFTLHTNGKPFQPDHVVSAPHILTTGNVIKTIGAWIVKLLLLALMVVPVVYLVDGIPREQRYVDEGKNITAYVTSCHVTGRNKHKLIFEYAYAYTVEDQTYAGTARGSSRQCYEVGKSVDIFYLASDPASSRIDGSFTNLLLWVGVYIVCLVGPALGFAAIVMPNQFRLNLRWRRIAAGLHQKPLLLEGAILAAKGEYEPKSNIFIVHLHYEFESPQSGTVITSYARAARPDLNHVTLPFLGTPINVLYINDKTHMML